MITLVLYSCTTTSYNLKQELSNLEKCKEIEPFFTKSRPCIKQSVISSQVLYPDLVLKMNELVDILEQRVNENKIKNQMAWLLLEENLVVATNASSEKSVNDAINKINNFLTTLY